MKYLMLKFLMIKSIIKISMYPYETNDDIPDEIWDIVDAFFDYDKD